MATEFDLTVNNDNTYELSITSGNAVVSVPLTRHECIGLASMLCGEDVEELASDSRFLANLFAAGVDNWEGYDLAQEMDNDEP